MKTRIVTGNKGGVGKSFISIMLADYLLRHDDNTFIVSDSEKATGQATTWNVLRRYLPEDRIKFWELGKSSGFEALADDLQRHAAEDVIAIVDTGASMMNELAANLGFLRNVQDALGIDVGIVFVAGPLPDSAVAARDFLRQQKQLDKPIETTFLLTSPTEANQNSFQITQDANIQEAIPKYSGRTVFLGPVRQEYFDGVMKDFRLPHAVLKDQKAGFGYRMRFDGWLKTTFDPLAAQIMEG